MDCKYTGWIKEGGGGRKEQTEQTYKTFTVTESRVLSTLATSRLRFFKIRNGGEKKNLKKYTIKCECSKNYKS